MEGTLLGSHSELRRVYAWPMDRSIENRASFESIRYANCWEDADLLCEALKPGESKRCLSIASGGDNSLALLAEGAEVVAVDLSIAQLSLVELKVAAIRRLDREPLLAFLGIQPAQQRTSTYQGLALDLSDDARAYWNAHPELIENGVIHQGKFEKYFHIFRTRILPLIHRRKTILSLLDEKDEATRVAFYENRWNNLRWRLLFRFFFSRFSMGHLGRDPEFFRYVEGSVAERILARTRYALTTLDPHCNPYMEYILTGNFDRQLPRYLRLDVLPEVKQRLDRLTLVQGTIQKAADLHKGDGFDCFNLSDIFEYLDPPTCWHIYKSLLQSARSGARLAYWNMLVPRSCPVKLADQIIPLTEESRRLFERDQAWFYSAFVLEEVR